MKKITLISTGTELINGTVRDENNFFISNTFFPAGINVLMHFTVKDDINDLKYAISEGYKQSDVVIITGGLGPTDDDMTIEALQQIFLFNTSIYQPAYNKIKLLFESLGREILPSDLKMATVPENSTVFSNDIGLAPGFSFKNNGKVIIAMPGVPKEMQDMLKKKILPFLLNEYNNSNKYCTIRTILMGESEVNLIINKITSSFRNISWGVTTQPGMNIISIFNDQNSEFDEKQIFKAAKEEFGSRMLMTNNENLETEVIYLLKSKKSTIATAESCTGGLIAKRITDIPGSSEIFMGGVVAYSNSSKLNILNVSDATLNSYGAVSEKIAGEMAENVRKKFNSTIGISTTGIAGPGGGTEKKPVGMVCFGLSTPEGVKTFTEMIKLDRERVRFYASQHILNRVRLSLLSSW